MEFEEAVTQTVGADQLQPLRAICEVGGGVGGRGQAESGEEGADGDREEPSTSSGTVVPHLHHSSRSSSQSAAVVVALGQSASPNAPNADEQRTLRACL